MSLIKILLLPILALCLISTQAVRFDIVNLCSYTVWPAAMPGGGRQLDSGETWSLDVAAGTTSGRIWGRSGCRFNNSGRGSCQTGDCGGALSCSLAGTSPITLAEFTLNGGNNLDYFDISVIDGFNIPMQFSSTTNGCNNNLDYIDVSTIDGFNIRIQVNATSDVCNKVLTCRDSNCPDAYQQPNDVKTVTCPGGTNYKIVFCP